MNLIEEAPNVYGDLGSTSFDKDTPIADIQESHAEILAEYYERAFYKELPGNEIDCIKVDHFVGISSLNDGVFLPEGADVSLWQGIDKEGSLGESVIILTSGNLIALVRPRGVSDGKTNCDYGFFLKLENGIDESVGTVSPYLIHKRNQNIGVILRRWATASTSKKSDEFFQTLVKMKYDGGVFNDKWTEEAELKNPLLLLVYTAFAKYKRTFSMHDENPLVGWINSKVKEV